MPSREYQDPSGILWEVFEVHRLNDRPGTVRPALSTGWLAFSSPAEKRRLPQYPADWMQLPDGELHALLRAAFLATDPISPVPPAGGDGPSAERKDYPLHGERRRRPRLTESAAPGDPPTVVPDAPLAVTSSPSPEPVDIDDLVRAHARQARKNRVAVIEGMIGVKRALSEAGADITPETLKRLRKVFVDEFYFAR